VRLKNISDCGLLPIAKRFLEKHKQDPDVVGAVLNGLAVYGENRPTLSLPS
jgi:hypothetical protein